ncbi:asparaginase [Streptomyces sp. SBT349]|uniref:asparaginase n=1 Tax=Streptomyces sp. SBT349 TaxID=1580539 RepID=UPI00069E07FB|nr:asparaginase [Streptomyces sp. SBT349]
MTSATSREPGNVLVLSLGGTIAMTRSGLDDAGVQPRLTGAELIAAVPGLEREAILQVEDVRTVPGASLTLEDVADLAERLNHAATAGVTGMVVTQGTDTLEETAFAVDLYYHGRAPAVLTGAMRPPQSPGADGPANLLAAVQTAASPAARDLGALVVMADEIHAARHVRKVHSLSTAAFASPGTGPLGSVVEGVPRLHFSLPRHPGIQLPLARPARVEVLTAALGSDGALLDGLEECVDGAVIAAFGAGHVPASWVKPLENLATRIPVVLVSRTGAGSILSATYAFDGSERDLLDRGLISGGRLDPYKARLLLLAHLRAGSDRAAITAAFDHRG